jgi:hypothetical protein
VRQVAGALGRHRTSSRRIAEADSTEWRLEAKQAKGRPVGATRHSAQVLRRHPRSAQPDWLLVASSVPRDTIDNNPCSILAVQPQTVI